VFNSLLEDNGGATLQKNAGVVGDSLAVLDGGDADSGDEGIDLFGSVMLDRLRNEFGEDRLIYGSNWPVSDRGAPYEVVFPLVREYFAGKGEVAMEKYFWRNALVAYGVK
jgi:hypothetical protein